MKPQHDRRQHRDHDPEGQHIERYRAEYKVERASRVHCDVWRGD